MASQPKHRRVLTDSSILGYNFGSSSISNFLSVSSLFSYASSAAAYKYLDLMVHAPCFPAKEINTESMNVQMQECLESIRISSPTQTDFVSLKDYINLQQTEENIHGNNWLVSVKHPSALDSFEDILGQAHGKQIAVFLDYDGTLSPIVDDPDQAYMSDEMRNALRKVAEHFPTAIITGRCRDKIFEFVQLPELYYAGSHGMDIIGPTQVGNGTNNTMALKEDPVFFQPHNSYLSRMEEVYNLLKERTEFFKGAKIENNKYCIAIHFRCVKEESWSVLVKEVFSILSEFPELRITQGRKVLELRPAIKWDKGKALDFLLKSFRLGNDDLFYPLYIGDDQTDEDAFSVLKDKQEGCGILVTSVFKKTNALYTLQNPYEVMEFLCRLVRWKSNTQIMEQDP